ncbi:MAG: hypothetical protein KGK08_13705 [Acidobacteriota bacterium]|nr:hypothetical protein [Acidobacteriota bacterium]
MDARHITTFFSALDPVCCALVLLALYRSGSVKKFPSLTALVASWLAVGVIGLSTMHLIGYGLERHLAYKIYFYSYWTIYAVQALLQLLVIYNIFQLAMAPLKGLASLGVLVFRWAAAISVALAFGIAVAPHHSGPSLIITAMSQLQQTTSILTLCLLLFVTFAIRPMGLNYGSRIFGVSLGMGLMATDKLLESAWLTHFSTMYSAFSIIDSVMGCVALIVWIAYFTLPEPKRRMIVLPTTSPFLHWNQISMALGDDPGVVAVGGVPPEMFAPAEVEIMLRASAKMAPASAAPASQLSRSA